MNEGIACCPENRTSTREAVVDAMLASGDELAQLQPALNLLSPPLNATPGEALLASCYEAGADHNADEATRAVSALPAAVVRSATPSLQRSGLLCMAAGALSARQLPLTHNRLCDVAGSSPALSLKAMKRRAVDFIPCAACPCPSTGGCGGITILTASVYSRRCCICWPGRVSRPGRGSRRSVCSGRVACWVRRGNLRY